MGTVEEVLQTIGKAVGIRDLTPGDVIRVAAMVLVGMLVIRLLMRMRTVCWTGANHWPILRYISGPPCGFFSGFCWL